eukprot:01906.XXX_976_1080_1 [CDS] Oithona nana genome sequencing.
MMVATVLLYKEVQNVPKLFIHKEQLLASNRSLFK